MVKAGISRFSASSTSMYAWPDFVGSMATDDRPYFCLPRLDFCAKFLMPQLTDLNYSFVLAYDLPLAPGGVSECVTKCMNGRAKSCVRIVFGLTAVQNAEMHTSHAYLAHLSRLEMEHFGALNALALQRLRAQPGEWVNSSANGLCLSRHNINCDQQRLLGLSG